MASIDNWKESKYYTNLEESDKSNYKFKLTLATGDILPDPYSLSDSSWKDDISLLPDVQWGDIYTYLINTPSEYTNENLKAYKSLEAYNFFVCGHVQDVYLHVLEENQQFVYIKTQVILVIYDDSFNFLNSLVI